MSTTSAKPADSSNISEAKVLIIILVIGFLATLGFRYHLAASLPKGDPRFIKKKATAEEMPPTDGNMLTAPPL